MAWLDRGAEPPRLTTSAGLKPERPRPRLVHDGDIVHRRGAACPPDAAQWAALVLLVGAPALGTLFAPQATWTLLQPLLFALFVLAGLVRLAAAVTPVRPSAPPRLPDDDLPRYTVIAPLYREAAVAPGLVEALSALDYPHDRLQVLIVLEADDPETWDALSAMALPEIIQLLVAPPGHPRTKPRACNVALERATGNLLTIYDAEDRPHPDQLREAAARFAAGSPRLACLQAPLRIDADRRFTPAQFGMEYAAQFEVVLPFLTRLGLPFPLGGTSNHFRIEALRALGGWDAWNVTEDADLGFRLAAEGYDLGVLTAPTLEAAPETLAEWLPQRTRWVKGYMQTFGVQARTPPHWRTGAAPALLLTLGQAIAAAALHGPLLAWILVGGLLHLSGGEAWIRPADLALLLFGWSCAALAAAVGLRRAGRRIDSIQLLLMPLYWPLHSLAAAYAVVQLFRAPHHWDKTPHRAHAAPRTGQALP